MAIGYVEGLSVVVAAPVLTNQLPLRAVQGCPLSAVPNPVVVSARVKVSEIKAANQSLQVVPTFTKPWLTVLQELPIFTLTPETVRQVPFILTLPVITRIPTRRRHLDLGYL